MANKSPTWRRLKGSGDCKPSKKRGGENILTPRPGLAHCLHAHLSLEARLRRCCWPVAPNRSASLTWADPEQDHGRPGLGPGGGLRWLPLGPQARRRRDDDRARPMVMDGHRCPLRLGPPPGALPSFAASGLLPPVAVQIRDLPSATETRAARLEQLASGSTAALLEPRRRCGCRRRPLPPAHYLSRPPRPGGGGLPHFEAGGGGPTLDRRTSLLACCNGCSLLAEVASNPASVAAFYPSLARTAPCSLALLRLRGDEDGAALLVTSPLWTTDPTQAPPTHNGLCLYRGRVPGPMPTPIFSPSGPTWLPGG